ncbi:hypothetical protein C0584_00235 [Candidatus Parcubacteria bacterium]|nr:MAG: hypothetical protein C0584_00235 [Candidatus Parcubacteria bacterium]
MEELLREMLGARRGVGNTDDLPDELQVMLKDSTMEGIKHEVAILRGLAFALFRKMKEGETEVKELEEKIEQFKRVLSANELEIDRLNKRDQKFHEKHHEMVKNLQAQAQGTSERMNQIDSLQDSFYMILQIIASIPEKRLKTDLEKCIKKVGGIAKNNEKK